MTITYIKRKERQEVTIEVNTLPRLGDYVTLNFTIPSEDGDKKTDLFGKVQKVVWHYSNKYLGMPEIDVYLK